MQENKTAINTQDKLLETKKLQKVFIDSLEIEEILKLGGGFYEG